MDAAGLIWRQPSIAMPALDFDEVHLWRTELQGSVETRKALQDILSASERAHAERYVRPHDRFAFIMTRGVLRRLLGCYLSRPPQSLEFEYNPYGKPFIKTNPPDPPLHFNVSHSGSVALYAFSFHHRVGIDVEQVQISLGWESIAQHYFTGAENRALRSLPPQRRLRAFFHCWTAKEAYIKAVGQGLGMDLRCFEIPIADELSEDWAFHVCGPEGEPWWLQTIPMEPGYAAALVVEGSCPKTIKGWLMGENALVLLCEIEPVKAVK